MALKILLADDSLTAQNMGKKILTEAGYEVIAVSNGTQAMKKIVSDNPDLVVLDVYMPGYSGLELCERMRSIRETAMIPVVLSVGKMEAFQPQEGNRVRADGLIIKPFEATELLAVVKKLAENVSSTARPKRRPNPEPTPEPVVETTPSAMPLPAEPEFEIQRQFVNNIPEEVASAPAIGMELIPEEVQEPETQEVPVVQQPPTPVEFELEQAPVRAELDPCPRMASADGLSGVFEMEQSTPPAPAAATAAAPVEGFESFSTPAEAPAQLEEAHVPSEESIATTLEHDFVAAPPEAYDRGAGPDCTAPPVIETSSKPAAVEPPSSFGLDQERLGQFEAKASAGSGSAQTSEILPERTSWEDAVIAPSAEMPRVPADTMLDNSEVEFAPAAAVWVAEETEIGHELAIPLHQQMEMQAREATDSTTVATPVESASEEAILSPVSCPPPTPVAIPAPELEDCATDPSEPGPQVPAPVVTEAPVDPARIASIVDRVLERLKPELIAAVTRELEETGQ